MKIFIIEDEAAIREELERLLQKYGYECMSSDNFQAISEKALRAEADLILLDINLPTRMDSRCAGRSVKNRTCPSSF